MSLPKKINDLANSFPTEENGLVRNLYQYYKTLYVILHNSSNVDHDVFVNFIIDNRHRLSSVSKTSINQLIFKKIKIDHSSNESIIDKKENVNKLNIDPKLFEHTDTFFNKKIKQYKNDLISYRDDLKYFNNEITERLNRIKDTNKLLHKLNNFENSASKTAEKIASEFIKIYESDLFEHVYFDKTSNIIFACQKHECVLTFEDVEYNFGKFVFSFSIAENSFWIGPYSNNISVDDILHPYNLAPDGLCFGSGSATFEEAVENYDLYKIFTLANHIMHEYYADNPATSILEFEDKKPLNLKEYYDNLEENDGITTRHKHINTTLFNAEVDESNHYGWMLSKNKKEVA